VAPSQRGVTRRQKLEVAEVGAVHTQCTCLVLEQEIVGAAAGYARPLIVRRDDDDPLGAAWALEYEFGSVG